MLCTLVFLSNQGLTFIYPVSGGLVLNPDLYGTPGKTDNMVHEVGHVFGLWHVHHGVSEMACDDPCLEVSPSLGLGDLVADTPPTPTNAHCGEPAQDGAACGFASFTNTPFKNYMAYSGRGYRPLINTHIINNIIINRYE